MMANKPAIMMVILLGVIASLGLFAAPAQADIQPIERYNQYSYTFDNPNNFANAKEPDTILQTWHADATGATGSFYFTTGVVSSCSWTGDGNLSVDNVVYTDTKITADITPITGLDGTTTLSAVLPLTVGVTGGLYCIEGIFRSSGGVNIGGNYIWQMKLPGDWSNTGAGTGDHQLKCYNSAFWTITKDFVFDGTNTTFSAYATGGYTCNNINIDFIIYGGPALAPVPPSLLLLGTGLLSLGLVGWRR